jgi:hypothetical protein
LARLPFLIIVLTKIKIMGHLYCRLLALHAYHNTEKDGDEIFLKIGKEKVWPEGDKYRSVETQTERMNVVVKLVYPSTPIKIDLFEYDSILSSKKIGEFQLTPERTGGPFKTDLSLKSDEYARYTLEWEVVRK